MKYDKTTFYSVMCREICNLLSRIPPDLPIISRECYVHQALPIAKTYQPDNYLIVLSCYLFQKGDPFSQREVANPGGVDFEPGSHDGCMVLLE